MKKQTVVEWLTGLLMNGNTIDNKIIQQALEMEKEQIIDSHLEGQYHADGIKAREIAQDYYNETFKSE